MGRSRRHSTLSGCPLLPPLARSCQSPCGPVTAAENHFLGGTGLDGANGHAGVGNGLAGFGQLRRESCPSPGQRASAVMRDHRGRSGLHFDFLKAASIQ